MNKIFVLRLKLIYKPENQQTNSKIKLKEIPNKVDVTKKHFNENYK